MSKETVDRLTGECLVLLCESEATRSPNVVVQARALLQKPSPDLEGGASTAQIITRVTPVIVSVWKSENNEMFCS